MSDFEDRVRRGLAAGAEQAPGGSGLAAAARGRARRRRRRLTGAVVAVAVVAVAVPVGVLVTRAGDGSAPSGGRGVDPSATGEQAAAPGLRTESWQDLTLEVPEDWGYGSLDAWCADGGDTSPRVERPGGVVPSIGCPGRALGVRFEESPAKIAVPSGTVEQAGGGSEWPTGSWVGVWYAGADQVWVATPERATTQAVVDSVRRVDDVEPNGCPVVDGAGAAPAVDGDDVTVCRYDGEGLLVQSERLIGDDARSATAAVADASPVQSARDCANPADEYVVLGIEDGERAEVQYTGQACSDRGLFRGASDSVGQQLTEDVLYWALSPGWSGAVAGWVPLPDRLRELEPAPAAPTPTETTTTPPTADLCPDGVFANSDFALDADPGGALVVCRMEWSAQAESGGSYLLAQERALTEEESDLLRLAVAEAEELPRSGFRRCDRGPREFYLVLTADGQQVPFWVNHGVCGENSVYTSPSGDGVVFRAVTQPLLDALGSPYDRLR